MRSSVEPSFDISRIWARVTLRSPAAPFWVRSRSHSRSSSVRQMTYFLLPCMTPGPVIKGTRRCESSPKLSRRICRETKTGFKSLRTRATPGPTSVDPGVARFDCRCGSRTEEVPRHSAPGASEDGQDDDGGNGASGDQGRVGQHRRNAEAPFPVD